MKLNKDVVSPQEIVIEFIEAKRSPRKENLQKLKDSGKLNILDQYDNFGANHNLYNMPVSFPNGNDDLLHCYESSTKPLEKILKRIIENQEGYHKTTCPYCNIFQIETVDHYLPKSVFPEFSFLPNNLVWCCSKCNTTKNDFYIENGKPIFLNPYFEDLDEYEFLECDIIIDNSQLSYSYCLNKKNIQNHQTGSAIEKQYSKLEVIERYKEKTPEVITNLIGTLHCITSCWSVSKTDAENWLKQEYNRKKRDYGANYYETAIYKGILKKQDVEDYIFNLAGVAGGV